MPMHHGIRPFTYPETICLYGCCLTLASSKTRAFLILLVGFAFQSLLKQRLHKYPLFQAIGRCVQIRPVVKTFRKHALVKLLVSNTSNRSFVQYGLHLRQKEARKKPIPWLHEILRYLDKLSVGRLKCLSNLHLFLSDVGETAGLPHHISHMEDIVYLLKAFMSMTEKTRRKKELVCTVARSETDRYVPNARSFSSKTRDGSTRECSF